MSLPPLLFGLAVLCWPGTCAARLRGLVAAKVRRRRRLPRPGTVVVAVSCGVAATVLSGLTVGAAAALAAATLWRRWMARHSQRTMLATVDALTEALRAMVAELRVGAHPAAAAESAAVDARPTAAAAMRAIAAAARLDGDIERALAPSHTAATAPVFAQFARAWALAQRYGLPLADVLDAVREDLQSKVRFSRQVIARMAGPRASAAVLALLPVVGLALGQAMGAHPVHILTATPTGQLLLLIGTTLACAGLTWTTRITTHVTLT